LKVLGAPKGTAELFQFRGLRCRSFPTNRARNGILCYGREVLAGADLVSLSRLPALFVFDACESARVRLLRSPD
jgi:hypothetical protein